MKVGDMSYFSTPAQGGGSLYIILQAVTVNWAINNPKTQAT